MADTSVTFNEERVTKLHSRMVDACAISPDGSLVATGSEDKTASVVDAATGNVIYTAKHEGWVFGVAWHSDGHRFVSSLADGTVTEYLRSHGNWSHRSVYKHHDSLRDCAASANGLVAVGCRNNCVVILNSNSNYSLKQTINGLPTNALCVAFSSDASLLAIGCIRGVLFIYGFNSSSDQYEQLARLDHPSKAVRDPFGSLSPLFNPSDFYLIAGGDDKTPSLCNVPSFPMDPSTWPQSQSFFLDKHADSVFGTCFTGDGRHVITASRDKTIRIWRVSDGAHVDTLQANMEIYSVSFHPITGRLIAGLEDGSLQSWLCPPYDLSNNQPSSYVDARIRLKNSQSAITEMES